MAVPQVAIPTNKVSAMAGDAKDITSSLSSLLDMFVGSKSTSTTQTVMSPEATNALITQMLQSNQGLATIAQGQKSAGLYNSTVNTQMTNDLLSRTAMEVAKAGAPTVTTNVKSPQASPMGTLAGLASSYIGGRVLKKSGLMTKLDSWTDSLGDSLASAFGGGGVAAASNAILPGQIASSVLPQILSSASATDSTDLLTPSQETPAQASMKESMTAKASPAAAAASDAVTAASAVNSANNLLTKDSGGIALKQATSLGTTATPKVTVSQMMDGSESILPTATATGTGADISSGIALKPSTTLSTPLTSSGLDIGSAMTASTAVADTAGSALGDVGAFSSDQLGKKAIDDLGSSALDSSLTSTAGSFLSDFGGPIAGALGSDGSLGGIMAGAAEGWALSSIMDVAAAAACFITTAVCEYSGKPDDCDELQVLRNFRDSYMLTDPDRRTLVDQYYREAPKIVTAIKAQPDAGWMFHVMRTRFIEPAITLIKLNDMEGAMHLYTDLFHYAKLKAGV